MTERGPDWVALGRVFARLPSARGDAPSEAAPEALGAADEDQALARDLAEERAAIMEYDGGLSRAKAEALAWRAHGLKLGNSG